MREMFTERSWHMSNIWCRRHIDLIWLKRSITSLSDSRLVFGCITDGFSDSHRVVCIHGHMHRLIPPLEYKYIYRGLRSFFLVLGCVICSYFIGRSQNSGNKMTTNQNARISSVQRSLLKHKTEYLRWLIAAITRRQILLIFKECKYTA